MAEEQIKLEGCFIGKDEFGKDFIAHCGCADCIGRSQALIDLRKSYLKNINKFAELEKENAELKAIKHFNPCGEWNDDVHDCEFAHYAVEYGNQLTKAKELIKEFMRISAASVEEYEPEFSELIGKAEQFVSEVKK